MIGATSSTSLCSRLGFRRRRPGRRPSAALLAASTADERVRAIVSRGGRPDLAGARALAQVRAPTLLIVGSRDVPVIELNQIAMQHLRCTKELVLVSGAHHFFEEPGALDAVVGLATEWFLRHLDAEAPHGP